MIRNSDIRKYVDFNSYTESLGWIGYYSRNCNYSNLLMNESICQFIYFFKPIITRFSIVTSLYKFGPKSIKTSQAQVQLMKSGYISDFTSNNMTEIEINSDMPLVIFEEPKWDIVRKLSSIIMNNDGDIAGHCFIIFEALNLIVYPHDDTGYGFISNTLNSNSFQIVNNFFKHLDTNKFMYQLKAD